MLIMAKEWGWDWGQDFKVGCAVDSHEFVQDFEAKLEAKLMGSISAQDPVNALDPL